MPKKAMILRVLIVGPSRCDHAETYKRGKVKNGRIYYNYITIVSYM